MDGLLADVDAGQHQVDRHLNFVHVDVDAVKADADIDADVEVDVVDVAVDNSSLAKPNSYEMKNEINMQI